MRRQEAPPVFTFTLFEKILAKTVAVFYSEKEDVPYLLDSDRSFRLKQFYYLILLKNDVASLEQVLLSFMELELRAYLDFFTSLLDVSQNYSQEDTLWRNANQVAPELLDILKNIQMFLVADSKNKRKVSNLESIFQSWLDNLHEDFQAQVMYLLGYSDIKPPLFNDDLFRYDSSTLTEDLLIQFLIHYSRLTKSDPLDGLVEEDSTLQFTV